MTSHNHLDSLPSAVLASKWIISTAGFVVLVYCLTVLGFVTTSPDVGLRCLLWDESEGNHYQPVIQRVEPWTESIGPVPEVGDRLLAMGSPRDGDWGHRGETLHSAAAVPSPIQTFTDFTRRLSELRSPQVPWGGADLPSSTPLLKSYSLLPPVVEVQSGFGDGRQIRWTKVEYWSKRLGEPRKCWLRVQALPVWEVMLTFVWFSLELVICAVAALAFWMRPAERQIRLFFVMCIVTCGAFVGGYHWWLIASQAWLSVPFTICAMLLPPVVLHFFLVYPEVKRPLSTRHDETIVCLYAIPVLCTAGMVAAIIGGEWHRWDAGSTQELRQLLSSVDWSIRAYVLLAGVYFLAAVAALLVSYFTARGPMVQTQVAWIMTCALIALVPVGYTIWLSRLDPVAFGLGQATIPMFTASLLFLLAYAVTIVRYKLMLVDQVLTRGTLYYVWSGVATAAYSVAVAAMAALVFNSNLRLLTERPLTLTAIVIAGVVVLGWFRARLQQAIDRRFFREKYHLDNLVHRVNQSLTQAVEPETVSSRMLLSCGDVLQVKQGAVYLRDPERNVLHLAAFEGCDALPAELTLQGEVVSTSAADRGESAKQAAFPRPWLHDIGFDLVHTLEQSGELTGVVLLGPKQNGAEFTAEDLAFLTSLGQITTVALHSVRVHQDLNRLNNELQVQFLKVAEQQRSITLLKAEIRSRTQEPMADAGTNSFEASMIKGSSSAIQQVLETVRKVSSSHSSVLVRGESGTGKELLARAIHENSPRRDMPMVSVHCGALSAGVLESELFGHVKGAFTGADRDRTGRFEAAHGGTLFLDEIGDISPETQVKLLRVLQERSFEPVGSSQCISVDVRIIAATHRDLEQLIREGKFREDLYYRLNVISITLPPLRQRPDDIVELIGHFLARVSTRVGRRVSHVDDDALVALRSYPWPGNIRELENTIERAVVLCDGEAITLRDLPPVVQAALETRPRIPRGVAGLLAPPDRVRRLGGEASQYGNDSNSTQVSGVTDRAGDRVTDRATDRAGEILAASVAIDEGHSDEASAEQNQLIAALTATRGNKAQAARRLGLPRSTFFSKLKKYGLS
jgi:transcriptional regulator with GAF, ATPase, and Fis domain